MSKQAILETLRKQVASFERDVKEEQVGTVITVGDGIARMSGLSKAMASEMLEFPGGTLGVTLNLEEETVGAILLGEYTHIKEGDTVKATGQILSIAVSDDVVGRVLNGIGQPIDGKGEIQVINQIAKE